MSMLSGDELDSSLYLALAKSIRKEFGLYNDNEPLLSSCRSYLGKEYDLYEDHAMVIIKEVWKKIPLDSFPDLRKSPEYLRQRTLFLNYHGSGKDLTIKILPVKFDWNDTPFSILII